MTTHGVALRATTQATGTSSPVLGSSLLKCLCLRHTLPCLASSFSFSGQTPTGDPPGETSPAEHRQRAFAGAPLHRLHPRE